MTPAPALAVLMVAGERRERAQRVLDAVARQSCRDLEIVVTDLAPRHPPLRLPQDVPTTVLPWEGGGWGEARALALRRSRAPFVAFIEDHCTPAPDWARYLIEAHAGPWGAVGYAFTNANPVSYIARASMAFDYGQWIHPARGGPSRHLPYNNVSYKRTLLESFGDRLEVCLGSDFHVHQELLRRGAQLYVEARALAAHENFETLAGLLAANHHYCRKLASDRVVANSWPTTLRIAYGLATPIVAPPISLWRHAASVRGRPAAARLMAFSAPILLMAAVFSSWGEALGYLFGAGSSRTAMVHFEVDAIRRALTTTK